MTKFLVALAAIFAASSAHADPITIAAGLQAYIGVTAAAAVATAVSFAATYGMYIYAAYSVYGSVEARRSAKRAAADARAAYNAGLQDRTATVLSADPPWRIVYGRCIVGGDILGIFTSNKVSVRADGSSYTKADGFKHIVVAIARHQIHAVHDTLIDGVSVGATSNGWATGGSEFANDAQDTAYRQFTVPPGGYIDEPSAGVVYGGAQEANVSWDGVQRPSAANVVVSIVGGTTTRITNNNSWAVDVWYTFPNLQATSKVRVEYHLGADDQLASAWLVSQAPSEWTTNDRLRGIAYAVITLDLEEPRFQGGPPGIGFDVSGRLVYDLRDAPASPRKFSENPALIAYDYITSPFGFGLSSDDVDAPSVVAAANACDVVVDHVTRILGLPITMSGPKWAASGGFTTNQSKEAILDDICAAMVGYAYAGPKWKIMAGAWEAPVMALSDSMLAGPIEVVQAGAGIDETFNGARIRFIPKGKSVVADAQPYKNSVFVAADGEELWSDFSLGFIDYDKRAYNAARILVERSRQSLVIRYPAKLHAWPLEVGDRVTITSEEYEWVAKTFRVTDWQFGPRSPVMLTLQEDAASVWDLTDETVSDPEPNTGLANPWVVSAIASLSATSGNNTLLRTGDGTTTERVLVSWAAISSPYVTENSKIVLRWHRVGQDAATSWRVEEIGASSSSAYLTGAKGGEAVAIEAYIVNDLGKKGPSKFITHVVVAKTLYPPNASDLAYENIVGGMRVSWARVATPDYRGTEVRQGLAWGSAGLLWAGTGTSMTWTPPEDGGYTVWVRHEDASGNESENAISIETAYVAIGGGGGGADGSNTAIVYLYAKTATPTPPATPSESLSYTFATGALSGGSLGGWTQTIPAGEGAYLYIMQARAYAAGLADTIAPGEWSTPQLMAKDGADGSDGLNTANVIIYRRLSTQPALPTADVTYTFSTSTAASLNNGWTQSVPSGTDQLWMSSASAVSLTDSDIIDPNEWATAQAVAAPGSPGTPGLNSATVLLFRRTASVTPEPAVPSATVTYTFSSGLASGVNNSWAQTLPTTGGSYRWMTSASAVSAAAQDFIEPNEWASPAMLAQDGSVGGDGESRIVIAVYRSAATIPATPAGGSYRFDTDAFVAPTSWSRTPPGASTTPVWVSTSVFKTTVMSAVVSPLGWTSPVKYTQIDEGSDGSPGAQAAPVYLYRWLSYQPGDPTGQSTLTWSTGAHTAYTGTNSWSTTALPNPGTSDVRLWIASKAAVGVAGSVSSTVLWSAGTFTVYALGANGAQGIPGVQAADPTVFRWWNGIPTIAGSSTYTWATRGISPIPTNWTLAPGAGSPGETLWGASVSLLESAGTVTSTISWSSASITPRGAVGADGDNGAEGISARRAYAITTAASLGSGTITSTGINSVPAAGSFGASTWSLTPTTPIAGQTLYQSDGLYNPSNTEVTWYTPYISALKVGNLSAIAVNTGSLDVNGLLTLGDTGALRGGTGSYLGGTVFVGYHAGNYKISAGNSSQGFGWNGAALAVYGGTITGALVRTAASGARVVIESIGSTGQLTCYADIGGSILQFAALGNLLTYESGANTSALFGNSSSDNSSRAGAVGVANLGTGVRGQSVSGVGVYGKATTGIAVYGTALSTGNAGFFSGGGAAKGTVVAYNSATSGLAIDATGRVLVAPYLASPEKRGFVSITQKSGANYSALGITRAAVHGVGMGVSTANLFWIGNTTWGDEAVLSGTPFLTINSVGSIQMNSTWSCNGATPQAKHTIGTDFTAVAARLTEIRNLLVAFGLAQ